MTRTPAHRSPAATLLRPRARLAPGLTLALSLSLAAALPVTLAPRPAPAHELSKAELKEIKKVMKTWAKALGVKCGFCHNIRNFKEWTAHREVAHAMKSVFLGKLKHPEAGKPMVCGTCHLGDLKPDPAALSKIGHSKLKALAPAFKAAAGKAKHAKAQAELKEIAEHLEALK